MGRGAYWVTLSVTVLAMGDNAVDAQINAENAAQNGAYDERWHDEAEAGRVNPASSEFDGDVE